MVEGKKHRQEASHARTTHVARGHAPTVILRMEVVTVSERGLTLDGSHSTIGAKVDDMIHECLSNGVRMNKLVIDLSDVQREVS